MLLGLLSRVYQERRRLIIVTSLAFLAGFTMYLRADLYVGGWHVAWMTGAVYAAIVGTCAVGVCLFLPSMRFMIEAVAVSRMILSLTVLAAPGLGYWLLSDPFITATAIVGGGMVVSRLVHGRILREKPETWRDRIVPQFDRRPVRINASALQARFVGWIDNTTPLRA